jgi:hypothetical protein
LVLIFIFCSCVHVEDDAVSQCAPRFASGSAGITLLIDRCLMACHPVEDIAVARAGLDPEAELLVEAHE